MMAGAIQGFTASPAATTSNTSKHTNRNTRHMLRRLGLPAGRDEVSEISDDMKIHSPLAATGRGNTIVGMDTHKFKNLLHIATIGLAAAALTG